MAVENPVGRAGAPLPIADPYTASGVRFPAGAQTRSVDRDGRIRFVAGPGGLAELLGWDTGALDTVGVEGWLVLTQRPDQVGAPRGRNRATAGFIVSDVCERVALRAAHLAHLGVSGGGHVLLAPVPERGALVVVDPCVCAALVPDRVGRLLAFDMPELDGWAIEPPDDDDDVLHDVADVDGDGDVFVAGGPAGFGGLRLVPPLPRAGGASR